MALRLGDLEQAEAEYLQLRERPDLSPYLSQVLEAKLLQAQRGLAAAKAPQPSTAVAKPNPLLVCLTGGSPAKLAACLEPPGAGKEEAATPSPTVKPSAPPTKAAPPPRQPTHAAPPPRAQPVGQEAAPATGGLPASLFLACAVLLLALAVALFSEEIDLALGGRLGQLQQSGGELLLEGRGRVGRALVTGRQRLLAPFVVLV